MSGPKAAEDGATILAFPTHQYTVEVVYRIRVRHQVRASSPTEAEELAPEEQIVGETEMLDILDARTVEVNVW